MIPSLDPSAKSSVAAPLVVGIGAATWDHFMLVDEFPHREGVSRATEMAEQGGGPVATALCTMACLGWQTCLIDSQSQDITGQTIVKDLQQWGVSTFGIEIHPGHTSTRAHVLVRNRDGARHIVYIPASCPEPLVDFHRQEMVGRAALLHLNGRHESAARQAVKIANQAGVPVSFDGGAGRFRESVRDLVHGSALRILAKEFALRFTSKSSLAEAAKVLLEDDPVLLVITDGDKGSTVWARGHEYFHQPATAVSKLMDTTGCGDVFHGAFLHGWLSKWPPGQCAAFAADLAAETAAYLGGREALWRRFHRSKACL